MATVGTLTYSTKIDTSGFKKGIDDIEKKTQSGGTSVKNIIAGLGITKLISTAFATINENLDGAIKRLDTMNNFPKVMSNLGIGAKESQKAIDKLAEGLKGIPTALDDGALAVQRFTSKNGDVEKSVDLFLAVNDAILAGGANTQIQSSALEQLSQAYAKGKMDMMEWRTIQMAMPAQLKQIATAMGLTTDELGEMMRQGDNTQETMDKFIDTIMEMDTKGVAGFKSLKEQARNATGGIQTSITNMKTAITRGIATMINEFDKVLKKKGFGGISDIITEIGKKAEGLFKEFSKALPTIIDIIMTLFNILDKLKPIIIAVVAAFISYKTAVAVATTAMEIFNAVMNANPIMLVITALSALIGLFITLANETDNTDKELKEMQEEMEAYSKSMEDIADRREKFLSKGMAEIEHYDDLYHELQLIVDENGKIKEGYEERAQFIVNQLSQALGVEIEIVDGQIQKYGELKESIEEVIQKKKDQLLLEAHEEEYKKALEEKAKREEEYGKAVQKNKTALEEYNKQLEFIAKQYGITSEEAQKMMVGIYDGTIKLNPTLYEQDKQLEQIYNSWYDYAKQLDDTTGTLEKEGELFRQNQEIIYNYDTALEALETGNRETFENIYKDTVRFTGRTVEDNKKIYDESIENNQRYLDDLMANQDKYSADFIKSEQDRIEKVNQKNQENYEKANRDLDNQNQVQLNKTIDGLNKQLQAIDSKKYEFMDAGNGNVQLYVDGIAQGQPVANQTAQNLVMGIVGQLNNGKVDAQTAGENLVNGVNAGINNKRGAVFGTITSLASDMLSRFKTALGEHSPSKETKKYGEWLLEGFDIGFKDEEDDVLKNVGQFGDDVLNKMKNAVNIQTGKMAFSGTSGTVNQIMTATGTTTVVNENKLLLDGDVVYENQKKVTARKNLQTQFGGAYNVSN